MLPKHHKTGFFLKTGLFDNLSSFAELEKRIFQNFQNVTYCSGTRVGDSGAWTFDFERQGKGGQQEIAEKQTLFALAVRYGDVPDLISGEPIPEPATIALLGIGLAGLAGAEVKRRRKRKAVDKS
jgi:hypothetical protein